MFTDVEIELLNRPAVNVTRLHYKDGMDWDDWRFWPSRDGEPGYFTDGHDYAGMHCWPLEGWTLLDPVVLPPETIAVLLRGLRDLVSYPLWDKVTRPLKRGTREAQAFELRIRLGQLQRLLHKQQG